MLLFPIAYNFRRFEIFVDQALGGEHELVVERRLRMLWQAADADVDFFQGTEALRTPGCDYGCKPRRQSAVWENADTGGLCQRVERDLAVDNIHISAQVAEMDACSDSSLRQADVLRITGGTDCNRNALHCPDHLFGNLRVELDRLDFPPDHPRDFLGAIAVDVRANDAVHSIGVCEIVRKSAPHHPGTDYESIHLRISPVSMLQNRRSSSSIGMPISRAKRRNLFSI